MHQKGDQPSCFASTQRAVVVLLYFLDSFTCSAAVFIVLRISSCCPFLVGFAAAGAETRPQTRTGFPAEDSSLPEDDPPTSIGSSPRWVLEGPPNRSVGLRQGSPDGPRIFSRRVRADGNRLGRTAAGLRGVGRRRIWGDIPTSRQKLSSGKNSGKNKKQKTKKLTIVGGV